jgi:hypothetical protein
LEGEVVPWKHLPLGGRFCATTIRDKNFLDKLYRTEIKTADADFSSPGWLFLSNDPFCRGAAA